MNVNEKISNYSEREQLLIPQNPQNKKTVSIFDVHNNGIVDEGDFSQKDLLNENVKNFLNKFINNEWTKELENKIADVLNTLNKANFEKENGKYKITLDNDSITIILGKQKTKIALMKDSSVTKEYVQKLFDALASLSDEEMEDFVEEVNGINLTPNKDCAGFFDTEKI